jgi:hypothetical protein
MAAVADMHKVRRHLTEQAKAHRQTRDEAALAAAVARAEQDARNPPTAPPGGLQGGDEGFWEIGTE